MLGFSRCFFFVLAKNADNGCFWVIKKFDVSRKRYFGKMNRMTDGKSSDVNINVCRNECREALDFNSMLDEFEHSAVLDTFGSTFQSDLDLDLDLLFHVDLVQVNMTESALDRVAQNFSNDDNGTIKSISPFESYEGAVCALKDSIQFALVNAYRGGWKTLSVNNRRDSSSSAQSECPRSRCIS